MTPISIIKNYDNPYATKRWQAIVYGIVTLLAIGIIVAGAEGLKACCGADVGIFHCLGSFGSNINLVSIGTGSVVIECLIGYLIWKTCKCKRFNETRSQSDNKLRKFVQKLIAYQLPVDHTKVPETRQICEFRRTRGIEKTVTINPTPHLLRKVAFYRDKENPYFDFIVTTVADKWEKLYILPQESFESDDEGQVSSLEALKIMESLGDHQFYTVVPSNAL